MQKPAMSTSRHSADMFVLLLLGSLLVHAATCKQTQPAETTAEGLTNLGRHPLTDPCGGPGQQCCTRFGRPCADPKSDCVLGKCKRPCGGLDQQCCDGSGDSACPTLGLACYNKKCVKCGNLGQRCCNYLPSCQQAGTVCNPNINVCVPCGYLGQGCCEGEKPCNNPTSNYCYTKLSVCLPRCCGGTGQTCCPGNPPCSVPKAMCVNGKCKDPCGGLNMRCCGGFEGPLDYSGSSGSRSCDRRLGIACYKGNCRPCGKKGQPCCSDGLACQDGASTCDAKLGVCVGCGALNQGCCVGGPPCLDLAKHMCSDANPSSGTCVVRTP